MKASACHSCSAPILWAATERMKLMPVDAEPVEDGTLLLQHFADGAPPTAHQTTEPERDELRTQAAKRGETLRLFKSHFATCEHADQHRSSS